MNPILFATMMNIFIAPTAGAAVQAWTMRDLDAVATAGIDTAAGITTNSTRASMLVRLADALAGAGATSRAIDVLAKAGGILDPPNDFMNSAVRGDIVRRLAELGDGPGAEALADVTAPIATKQALLGKLGAGRARAGDIAGAQAAARSIDALPQPDRAELAHGNAASAAALAEIGVVLGRVGAFDQAVQLADNLPIGLPKLRVQGQVARSFCTGVAGHGADTPRGVALAEQAAKSMPEALASTRMAYEKADLAQPVAEALAECVGAARAKAFVAEMLAPDQAFQVLSKLADALTDRQEVVLARAVAPTPGQDDVDGLVDTAKRLVKQNDMTEATRVAEQASGAVQRALRDAGDGPRRFEQMAPLGGVFDVLLQVGAYESAIATVQPIEIVNRQQFYGRVLQAAVNRKDAAAIARVLPVAIGAVKLPTPVGSRAPGFLYELTRILAVGGFQVEARAPYDELLAALNAPSATPLALWQLAILKADMSGIEAGLTAADAAGSVANKPNAAQILALTAMLFDGATHKPTDSEVAAAVKRATAALPPLVAGPKAKALAAIATDMAARGDITAALQAEAALQQAEAAVKDGTRDTFTGNHDSALVAIANAQAAAGDPHGSLATTLRITQSTVRFDPLLNLAAISPSR